MLIRNSKATRDPKSQG